MPPLPPMPTDAVVSSRRTRPVSRRKAARIRATFAAFAPTAPVNEPGGLPRGWRFAHGLRLRRQGEVMSASYHLLYHRKAWVFTTPVYFVNDDTGMRLRYEKKGDVSAKVMARSVGDLFLQMQQAGEPWNRFAAPLLTEFIIPRLRADDPMGFLLRLGGEVDLPEECYSPAFGAPTP